MQHQLVNIEHNLKTLKRKRESTKDELKELKKSMTKKIKAIEESMEPLLKSMNDSIKQQSVAIEINEDTLNTLKSFVKKDKQDRYNSQFVVDVQHTKDITNTTKPTTVLVNDSDYVKSTIRMDGTSSTNDAYIHIGDYICSFKSFANEKICKKYLHGNCSYQNCKYKHWCMFCMYVNNNTSNHYRCRCESRLHTCHHGVTCKYGISCKYFHNEKEKFLFLVQGPNQQKDPPKDFCKICYSCHPDRDCIYYPINRCFADDKPYINGLHRNGLI